MRARHLPGLACVCAASVAHADEPPCGAICSPGFVTLERFDGTSQLGVEATHVELPRVGRSSDAVAAHAQFADITRRFGVYIGVQKLFDDEPRRTSTSIRAGALVAIQGSPDFQLVLHGGVIAGLLSPYLAQDTGSALAAGASVLARSGPVYGRCDLTGGTPAAWRLDAGLGYELGPLAPALEVAWTPSPEIGSAWFGALSVRYTPSLVQPYIAGLSSFDRTYVAVTVGAELRR